MRPFRFTLFIHTFTSRRTPAPSPPDPRFDRVHLKVADLILPLVTKGEYGDLSHFFEVLWVNLWKGPFAQLITAHVFKSSL